MLFIAGRGSKIRETDRSYYSQLKSEWEEKGMMVGLADIDTLLDIYFTMNYDIGSISVLDMIRGNLDVIKAAPETVRWVIRESQDL